MASNVLACTACMRRLVLAPLASRALYETALFASHENRFGRRAASTNAMQTKEFEEMFRENGQQGTEREANERQAQEKLAEQFARRKLAKIDDPFHIGHAVTAALKEGKFEGALRLTEKASRTMNVVVSWNALIEYQLSKGESKNALKTFNSMKKRGQLPNVYTFTTIFSGLANCPNKSVALADAVKHYHMLLQDTRLEANIIHTNAVLRLCAMAHDIDQMFLVANTLNNTTRTPDATTYTVLLEGIRYKIISEINSFQQEEEREFYKAQMTNKALVLWSEVERKWKMGRLDVDERLVIAMARTLPFARKKDQKHEASAILDLLHEMMDLPNYEKYPDWDKEEAQRLRDQDLAMESDPKRASKALASAKAERGRLVNPTTRTLALTLEVLGAGRKSVLAMKYWNKLVNNFGVQPDPDNYFRMLLALKYTRSSAHALSLLQNNDDVSFHAGHFLIALEACIADNINPNAVSHAQEILMLARTALGLKNQELMKLCRLCLRVPLVSNHKFRRLAQHGKKEEGVSGYGRQIASGLQFLWGPYHELQTQWFEIAPAAVVGDGAAERLKTAQTGTGAQSKEHDQRSQPIPLSEGQLRNAQREVIALARNMYAAYNKVIVEQMLPEKELTPLRVHAATLNREIQRFYSDRAEHEPNLPPMTSSSNHTKRRKRLPGAATAHDISHAASIENDREAKSLGEEADELASDLLPATQDMVGIKRVGGETVWSTRKIFERSPTHTRRGRRLRGD